MSPCELSLGAETIVIVSVLVSGSTFLSALMTYWWTAAFHLSGAFLPTRVSSGQPFPCLRFRSGLSPFWSFLSLLKSISSWVGPHTTSLPQSLFEFSMRINVLKRKGLEEDWQACVTGERFTWGHKSWGERRGGISHTRGSVCGDREVNWPRQAEGRTAPHTPPAHTPIHALPSSWWLFGFGQNTPT